jgi:single-strand DNA-binding protein
MNIVVLHGRLSAAPTFRELADGTISWSFDVVTTTGSGRAVGGDPLRQPSVSVPVTWHGSAKPQPWQAQTELVIAGVVRRRFFRTGGVTQSRTEVQALGIAEVTKRRGRSRAIEQVLASLPADEVATLRFGQAS